MTRKDLKKITGGMTVPQIVINGVTIGGFDQLLNLNQRGKLEEMLKK